MSFYLCIKILILINIIIPIDLLTFFINCNYLMSNEIDFEWEERKEDVDFKSHFLAGSMAGLSEHLFFLPIDNIKT